MKYGKLYQLQTGDQIIEPLFSTGLTKHHAIYLGHDLNNVEWIAENHNVFGVRIIDANTYFQNVRRISRIDRFQGTLQQRQAIVQKALSLVGKPYNLITYNCEHFVNEVIHGKSESKQILNAFGGLALGLVFVGIFSSR